MRVIKINKPHAFDQLAIRKEYSVMFFVTLGMISLMIILDGLAFAMHSNGECCHSLSLRES